ncbi:MAG TPA: Hsp20/alpha crystallin family protein [Thermoleophilaceae bacterium]|nr:Hsp20/alpha crystallin family protein [Thermoleophilaceae bacterium]
MALVVNPQPFSRDVDRLFDAFFGGEREARRWVPQMDLVEAEDHFVLKADLPGLDDGDVSIEVQDGTLTISGERKAEHESRERGWYRIERAFGSFSRSLTLPDRVDPDRISANFDRGVLEVRIPKPEEHKPRRVEIKAGATRENGGAPAVEGSAKEA